LSGSDRSGKKLEERSIIALMPVLNFRFSQRRNRFPSMAMVSVVFSQGSGLTADQPDERSDKDQGNQGNKERGELRD